MPTNHHTPHAFGAPLTSTELNGPLSQLDAAIDAAGSAGAVKLAPTAIQEIAAAGFVPLSILSNGREHIRLRTTSRGVNGPTYPNPVYGGLYLDVDGMIYMMKNAYDTFAYTAGVWSGSGWNRGDTTEPAGLFGIDSAGVVCYYYAAAGANPITWGGPMLAIGDSGAGHTRIQTTKDLKTLIFAVAPGGWAGSPGTTDILKVTDTAVHPLGTVDGLGNSNITLGYSGARWAQLHAATATISTSDERIKDWRGGLNDKELRVAKALAGLIGIYQVKEAVKKKGKKKARLHTGVVAQKVAAAFEAEGLDPTRYSLFCYDEWDEQKGYRTPRKKDGAPSGPDEEFVQIPAGDSYGIRYEELLAFCIAGQEQRLAALEAAG